MQIKTIALAVALTVAPGLLHAQFDFQLAGRNVQVHSFASQVSRIRTTTTIGR